MEKIKKVNKRICAWILVVALIGSLLVGIDYVWVKAEEHDSAAEIISETEMKKVILDYDNIATCFDFNPYVLKHYSDNELRKVLAYRTENGVASKGMVEYLDNSEAFQASYVVWKASDFITNAIDATKDMVYSPYVYYETVLLHSLIDYCNSDNVIESINKSELKYYGKLTKNLYDSVKYGTEYQVAGKDFKNNVAISSMSDEGKDNLTKWLTNYVDDETEKVLGPVLTKDNIDNFNTLLSESKDIKSCIDKIATYVSLKEAYGEMANYMQSLIEEVEAMSSDEISDTEKTYFLLALNNVKAVCESSATEFVAFVVANGGMAGGKTFISKTTGSKWKQWMIDSFNAEYLNGGEAGVNLALLAISLTKTVSNLGFSTNAKLENYDLMKRVVTLEKAETNVLYRYLNSQDSEDAGVLMQSVNVLYKTYDYDLDLYEKMLSLSESDWVNLGASQSELTEEKNNVSKVYRVIIKDELERLSIPHGMITETTAWCITDNGHLCIYGHGTIPDYEEHAAPWYQYKEKIKAVDVSADVTSLGNYVLSGLTSICKDIIIERAITTYENCFNGIDSSVTLIFADSPRFLRQNVFDCKIYCEKNLYVGTGASGWPTEITFNSPVYVVGNAEIIAGGSVESSFFVGGNVTIYNKCREDSSFVFNKNSSSIIRGNVAITVLNLWDAANALIVEENATLIIDGNLAFQDKDRKKILRFVNNGTVIIGGAFNFCNGIVAPWLDFESSDDSILEIYGNVITNYAFNFTAGTLILHGYSEHNWYGGWSFGGNAVLKFSGSNFDAINCDGGKIIIEGEERPTLRFTGNVDEIIVNNENGVILQGDGTVNTLFNHNGYYRSWGNNMTFPDYDGDGLKDNVDPHPLVPESLAASQIILSDDELNLYEDDIYKVTASVLNSEGDVVERVPEWISSDENVFTVDASGTVTAISEGKAILTAMLDRKKVSIDVNVLPNNKVEYIKINPSDISISLGKNMPISVEAYNSRNQKLEVTPTYVVEDENVCSVDDDGLITTIHEGSTTVFVTCGEVTESVKVKVTEPVNKVVLMKTETSSIKLSRLKTQTIDLYLYNEDNIELTKAVTWASSNRTIAIVDKNGKVTAVGIGSAKITATVDGQTLTIPVTVTPYETITYKVVKTVVSNIIKSIFNK